MIRDFGKRFKSLTDESNMPLFPRRPPFVCPNMELITCDDESLLNIKLNKLNSDEHLFLKHPKTSPFFDAGSSASSFLM